MTTLYLEPFGGMAGDMLLAALCDLGHDAFGLGDLRTLADDLVPGQARLDLEEVRRGGLRARHLEVRTPETGSLPHRHLGDLLALIAGSALPARVASRAGAVLRRLAEAESTVHGIAVEEVHLHEVGAVDTLIDVCGAVLALERLGVERVVSSRPYVGGGMVRCAHGEMPVPAPGTQALLVDVPVRRGPGGERLTPTAAALLAEIVDEYEPEEAWTVRATGYGAGRRDPDEGPPNLVRVSLCVPGAGGAAVARPEVWLLEFNLDDATGEEVGFLLGELRAAGALEAWSAAVQMKKDRPGTLVSALCRPADRGSLERAVFDHSPTLGVRWSRRERTECAREELEVELEGAAVRVKLRRRADQPVGPADLSPEFDDLAALARRTGRSLRDLEHAAVAAAVRRLEARH